jgi:pyruvate ferredoxin oxidoreductase delta subunit|tara:strand:+ start:2029 stop:2229 length:201 start_codon:yes stop_codon:yes gene_type:complete
MYCPESDCIMLDKNTTKATVVEPRCKGCDLCKVVCSTHNAITMFPVDATTGKVIREDKEAEAAALG